MPDTSPTPDADLASAIDSESQRLGLAVPVDAMPLLAAYASALWQWNTRLNLTRHTDVARFVARDVADAVAIAGHLATSERVLDVGTGGGVPGVLLAILRPDLDVELCDSVGKRASAVEAIVKEAGLRLQVHARPAQQIVAEQRFDSLVVRAVAPLVKLLTWFEPLSDRFGRMLIIKGPRWEAEKGEARHRGLVKRVRIRRIAAWPLHETDNESVLLEVHHRDIPS
ncbi:MAG: 16S rRNA (guanine(527)-N(7))-methyltransferase RsmG [Pirellulales bacterium]|jgi:16S rRNA (guanine527-N7)-methyltransferase